MLGMGDCADDVSLQTHAPSTKMINGHWKQNQRTLPEREEKADKEKACFIGKVNSSTPVNGGRLSRDKKSTPTNVLELNKLTVHWPLLIVWFDESHSQDSGQTENYSKRSPGTLKNRNGWSSDTVTQKPRGL